MSDYDEMCRKALQTKVGDVWVHRKTGKKAVVVGRPDWFRVQLKHESGRETIKQHHYLASDFKLQEIHD